MNSETCSISFPFILMLRSGLDLSVVIHFVFNTLVEIPVSAAFLAREFASSDRIHSLQKYHLRS